MSDREPSGPTLTLEELAALLDDETFEAFYFDMVAAARCSVPGAEEKLLRHIEIICSEHNAELPPLLGQWLLNRLPRKRRGKKRNALNWRRDLRLARLVQEHIASGLARTKAAEAAREQLWAAVLESIELEAALGDETEATVLRAARILGEKMQKNIRGRIRGGTPPRKAVRDLRDDVLSDNTAWVDVAYVVRQHKQIFGPPSKSQLPQNKVGD